MRVTSNDPTLSPVSDIMSKKLNEYAAFIGPNEVKLTTILDPRFKNGCLKASSSLQRHVCGPGNESE